MEGERRSVRIGRHVVGQAELDEHTRLNASADSFRNSLNGFRVRRTSLRRNAEACENLDPVPREFVTACQIQDGNLLRRYGKVTAGAVGA